VTATMLLTIFDSVYVIALTAWVGSILFFSFAVAPIIFNALGPEAGGKFVRALFPRYYLWGVISCSIALPALVCGTLAVPELRGSMIGVQAFAIVGSLLILLYCGNSLTPAINAARDAGPSSSDRFDRLHKRSVTLNSVVLLIGLALLIAFASRKAPISGGIVERPVKKDSHTEIVPTSYGELRAVLPRAGRAVGF
jgi:MFS family permease